MKNQRQTAPDGRATAKSAQHEKPPAKHERERDASESIAPSRALARMTNSPRHVTPGDVRTLQHTIGNHAIGQLLLGGHRSAPPRVQRKALTVGAANDIFEQRAEAAADEIMRMPDDAATPVSEEVLQPRVQRSEAQSAAGAGSFQADADFTSRVEGLGSGAPLDRATRDFMEPRFGSDLGHLRVQDGPRAAELNREIGARAFTHEHQIVMGEGAYNPGTTAGRHLLAHEITHTFQQRATHHHVIQRQVYKSKADRTVITWQAFKAKLKKKGYSSAVIQSMHETFVSYKSVSTPDTTEEALLKKAAILASGVAAEVDDTVAHAPDAAPAPAPDVAPAPDAPAPDVAQAPQAQQAAVEEAPDDVQVVTKTAETLVRQEGPQPPDIVEYHEMGLGDFYDQHMSSAMGAVLDIVGFKNIREQIAQMKRFSKDWEKRVLYAYGIYSRKTYLEEMKKAEAARKPDDEIFKPVYEEAVGVWGDFKKFANEQNVDNLALWSAEEVQDLEGILSSGANFAREFLSLTAERYDDAVEDYPEKLANAFEPMGDESARIPDQVNAALEAMRQGSDQGACNLAASLATMLMSGSAKMMKRLSDFVLSDDGDTVKYRFHGGDNALQAYRDRGADLSTKNTIRCILEKSRTVYEVDRSRRLDSENPDLLPFTAPWIYCLAVAFYEYAVDIKAADAKSYNTVIELNVTKGGGQETETIAYNFLTNQVGEQVTGSDEHGEKRLLTDAEIASVVPEDDGCRGKMFKLGSKHHATALVCTWGGEKRFYDNQHVKKGAPYTVKHDQTIREIIKARKTVQVFVSEIPQE